MSNFKWDTQDYQTHLGYVSELTDEIISWLSPRLNESILDIGCGDGRLTLDISKRCSRIDGLEPDENMAAVALKRGLFVHSLTAQKMEFREQFDAVFSNATFHWLQDPDDVLSRCYDALKFGGRLVVEQGGDGNLAALRSAIRASLIAHSYDPDSSDVWDLPTIETQISRLEKAGFSVRRIENVYRHTPISTTFENWFDAFKLAWLGEVRVNDLEKIVADIRSALEGVLISEHGEWFGDYVRLRYEAVKL